MEPRELLERLVAVVASLGELVAAVAGPHGDIPLAVSPGSLHGALGTFLDHLRDTLGHPGATSLGHPGATSLSRALATLGATAGPSRAQALAVATAWHGSVAALGDSWARLAREATELRRACRDTATAEATAAATARARAGDLGDSADRWGTAGDSLVAAAGRLPVALDKDGGDAALAKHQARVAAATAEVVAATDAFGDAVVATSRAGAATARARRAQVALGPLGSLVASCDKATALPRELLRTLGDIEATLAGTEEEAPDVPEAAVAAVAEAERLWEASARLALCHLGVTLSNIRVLLVGGPGGPGGPSVTSVAERCQKAIKDIPRLLEGQ